MTTKAKNKDRRRPVGRKPAAGTRRGAKRVPGSRATRRSSTGARGARPYAGPGNAPAPLLVEALGGTDGILVDEGGMGE